MRGLIAFLLLACSANGALINHGGAGATSGFPLTVSTSGINMTGATFLSASCSWYNATSPTVVMADSSSNTWVPLTVQSSGVISTQLFVVVSPTVSSSQTFTCSSVNSIYPSVYAAGFSFPSAVFDQQGGGGTTSTAIPSGPITTLFNGELIIASLTNTDATVTIDSSFTITDQVANVPGVAVGGALAYFVQTTAGTINPTWTLSSSAAGGASMASYKPTAAAGAAKRRID